MQYWRCITAKNFYWYFKLLRYSFHLYLISFFIAGFNLLSYELESFTSKLLYWAFFKIYIIFKWNKITIVLQFLVKSKNEKCKMVFYASSRMKNIVIFRAWSRFPVKLTCYVTFGSVSSSCCIPKSIDIVLQCFMK